MTGRWSTSRRRRQLPPDWDRRVRKVRERADGICEWPGCHAPGTECDHWRNPQDHSLEALRWLCTTHHQEFTQQQAAAARAAIRRKLKPPSGPHPGLRNYPETKGT